MRKSHLITSLAACTLLLTASCSQDDFSPAVSDVTTFTVQLPEQLGTRAYGDNPTTQKLYVAIYPAGSNEALFTNWGATPSPGLEIIQFGGGLTATVNVKLVKGYKYDIVFWAQDPSASTYTFDEATRSITVAYGTENTINNFAENRDAFYAQRVDFTVKDSPEPVILKRPFAQINVLTRDLDDFRKASSNKTDQFGMKVENVANVLNLFTNEVSTTSDFNGMVTLSQADPVGVTEAEYTDYDYLDMGYFLVGGPGVQKNNLTVTMTVGARTSFVTWPNIPAQMNYRTNIYGDLLTSPQTFNVEIKPAFDGNFNGENGEGFFKWDGVTATDPVIENNSCEISSADELAGLAKMVNEGRLKTSVTVNITEDIDLGGHPWTPIGNATRSVATLGQTVNGNSLNAVVNGNGHTISNLTLTSSDANTPVGFIGSANYVRMSNLNFENVNVDGSNSKTVGAVVGVSTNSIYNNVHVLSGTVTGMAENPDVDSATDYYPAVGGIAGAIVKSSSFTGCSNAATVTSATPNVGGIAGGTFFTPNGSTISQCTNTGNISALGVVGGILGNGCSTVYNCKNTGTITSDVGMTGGIVGEQDMNGKILSCTNEGDVICKSPTGWGNGGIVGWLRYYLNPDLYKELAIISVTYNVNKGSVKGGNDAGGIVGTIYSYGYVDNNSNYAPVISASQFAAGIVASGTNGIKYPAMEALTGKVGDITVKGNLSTTPITAITARFTDLFIYQNSANIITAEGNRTE